MLNLVVGDPHVTADQIEDAAALMQLVLETAKEEQVTHITFMGDLFDNHNIVSVEVLEFWDHWLRMFKFCGYKVIILVGNHDMVSARTPFPHALVPFRNIARVIDCPVVIEDLFLAMPYVHSPEEFLKQVSDVKEDCPELEVLFCHQTFIGADGGFYAKDECNAVAVPFKKVFSGHIHAPQVIDKKVFYVGAPRWHAKNDAKHDRYIYVFNHVDTKTVKLVRRVPTDTVCKRIYLFEDSPEAPFDILVIPEDKRKLASIRVEIKGPLDYTKTRYEELLAQGVRARVISAKGKATKIRESIGIQKAFESYLDKYVPLYSTPKDQLVQMLKERSL